MWFCCLQQIKKIRDIIKKLTQRKIYYNHSTLINFLKLLQFLKKANSNIYYNLENTFLLNSSIFILSCFKPYLIGYHRIKSYLIYFKIKRGNRQEIHSSQNKIFYFFKDTQGSKQFFHYRNSIEKNEILFSAKLKVIRFLPSIKKVYKLEDYLEEYNRLPLMNQNLQFIFCKYKYNDIQNSFYV
ncbi:hypothetical protein pb186bvf_002106 [Paramecium bursaria]